MDKYHPGYFGKVGMRYFHKQGNHFWKPIINLDKVCSTNVYHSSPRTAILYKLLWEEARIKMLIPFFPQLWSLVPAEKRAEYIAGKNKETVPVLDLLSLGYSKVLGKGRIPEIPLVVRARWVSKEAERKITEAGGVVELVA